MTLRILHVLDHSAPLHSGYTFRTLSIVREQRRLGWMTYHLTTPKQVGCTVAEEDVDGLHFYRTLPAASGRQWPLVAPLVLMQRVARRLGEVVANVQPHLIHAHSPVLTAIPALYVGRRHRIPVVYEVRAFWEDAAVDLGTAGEGGLRYRLTRRLETYALERVDAVTTICEGLRSEIVARGIPASRVTVVPNAVDVETFHTRRAPDPELRDYLGIGNGVVVGFVGSFYRYEGLDLLLEAAARIAPNLPGLRILLVGGGPEEERLRALARQLGIADRCIFAGRVAHHDVQRYYDLIDVLAYPRRSIRLTELVTPLKPLEAMAQARMLVASDVGGHRELIEDGRTGVLFEAGNSEALAQALVRVIAERDRWPVMGAAGRAYVERERAWPVSVARYRDVFARIAPAACA